MRVIRDIRFLVLILGILLVASCTTDHAGGAGSETNSGLTARFIDMQGKPKSQIAYSIRPSWYVRADSTQSAWNVLPIPQYANGVSDSKGYVELPMMAPGTYVLDVQDDSEGILYELTIQDQDTALALGNISLNALARVNGIVPLPHGVPVRLRVYGTERVVWTDSVGRFVIEHLPPGRRMIRVDHPNSGRIYSELTLNSQDTSIDLDTIPMEVFAFESSTWNYHVELPLDMALHDSVYEAQSSWSALELPLLIPIDRDLVDFSKASPVGADVRITNENGQLLPMQIRYWDPMAGRALLWVRGATGDMQLHYGKPGAVLLDSIAGVWRGWSDSLKTEYTHITVDNFEDGNITNMLPGLLPKFEWYRGRDSLSSIIDPPNDSSSMLLLQTDTTGRSAKAIRLRYSSSMLSWVLMGCLLSQEPKDLRMLDSIVVWARGNGYMMVALENGSIYPEAKAWKQFALSNTWTRYRVRPGDFDEPGIGGNVGWLSVRSFITTLSVFAQGGNEIWIDDVELYGIHPLELR